MKDNEKQKSLTMGSEPVEQEPGESLERIPVLAVPSQAELEEARRVDIETVIDYAEKKVELYKRIRTVALKATTEDDWIIQKDGPYLMERGASSIANLYGVDIPAYKVDREMMEDEKGRYFIFTAIGSAFSRSLGRWVSDIGTCSQRDKFFGTLEGELKPMEDIDLTMIKKKAGTNLKNRLVKSICGLLNVTMDDLKAAGLNVDKIKKIEYKSGRQKREATLSKEAKQLRDKLWGWIQELTAGAPEAARAVLEKHSAFKGRDDKIVTAKSKEDLTSEKWIKATYGRVKAEYEKAFGKVEDD